MTGLDSQNLNVCCTAKKLLKIKEFLVFAFAKKQSKGKKAKKQRWLGMSFYLVTQLAPSRKKDGVLGVLDTIFTNNYYHS